MGMTVLRVVGSTRVFKWETDRVRLGFFKTSLGYSYPPVHRSRIKEVEQVPSLSLFPFPLLPLPLPLLLFLAPTHAIPSSMKVLLMVQNPSLSSFLVQGRLS